MLILDFWILNFFLLLGVQVKRHHFKLEVYCLVEAMK